MSRGKFFACITVQKAAESVERRGGFQRPGIIAWVVNATPKMAVGGLIVDRQRGRTKVTTIRSWKFYKRRDRQRAPPQSTTRWPAAQLRRRRSRNAMRIWRRTLIAWQKRARGCSQKVSRLRGVAGSRSYAAAGCSADRSSGLRSPLRAGARL